MHDVDLKKKRSLMLKLTIKKTPRENLIYSFNTCLVSTHL